MVEKLDALSVLIDTKTLMGKIVMKETVYLREQPVQNLFLERSAGLLDFYRQLQQPVFTQQTQVCRSFPLSYLRPFLCHSQQAVC